MTQSKTNSTAIKGKGNAKSIATTRTTSTASTREKKPGTLNLVRVFDAEALDLITAVERGRILHETQNIRDSGSTLEARFRTAIAARLPSQFDMLHGYLFDRDSKCTPEIDAILVETRDCFGMIEADGGAAYLPFTAALALIEIKNSASDAIKAFNQLAKTCNIVTNMRDRALGRSVDKDKLILKARSKPITIAFFATSDSLKLQDIKNWYSNNANDRPTYAVFLDRGLIIADRHFSNLLFSDGDKQNIGQEDHLNADEPYFCRPKHYDKWKKGRALLWLFFALVSHANRSESYPRSIGAFARDAANRYALGQIKPVRTVAMSDLVSTAQTSKSKAKTPAKTARSASGQTIASRRRQSLQSSQSS